MKAQAAMKAIEEQANRLSAVEAAQALEEGSLRSETLVAACLERIRQRDPELLAFTALDADGALRSARAVDASRKSGGSGARLLAGIPFAVKDVIETADLVTSYGSPIHAGHRPHVDAGCVALAKEQGAILLGKVATSEFATQSPGPSRNPHNPAHTPGGSSSGPAVAVADYMVPVAFGTQTTASIVRPASYCGIVGYKPTFGFIGIAGLKPLSFTQDTIGLLTRTVADAAFFSFGLHGSRVSATPADVRPRLAVCRSRQWEALFPEMVEAIERLAADASALGARVSQIKLPPVLEDLIALQGRLFAFEARQSLAHERLHHADQFSARLQQRLDGGLGISAADYLGMRRLAAAGRRAAAALFDDVDALLYPPAQGEAPAGIADSGPAHYGALWSLLHLPCMSIPMARGPKGLPLGIQAIGPYGDDEKLFATAAFVEQCAKRRLPAA